MEYVTKGVYKLLGDYRLRNICKKLKKLQQKDTAIHQRHQLQVQLKEGLDRIPKFIGNPGDVVNKAHLFDNDIKTRGQLSLPKIITILVEFGCRMEGTLAEMQKLGAGPQLEPIRAPLPSPKPTPQKDRPLVELKTPLPQYPGKELVVETPKIKVPAAPTPSTKMIERESETPKTTSSEPSPWRSNRKK